MVNEKRLIDANALVEKLQTDFEKVYTNAGKKVKPEDYYIERKSVYDADFLMAEVEMFCTMVNCFPTVEAVEVADMKEFAEDVAYQFGYYCQNGGRLCITHGGLSTLEWAFDILGWENPHPVPECECEIEGCHEHATCGTPTADGYKRVCGQHFRSIRAKMDGDGNE